MNALLVSDRSRPTLRQLLGGLLSRAVEADFAVARIRLAVIDLSARETARVRRCRVLVGQLDVDALAGAGGGADDPARSNRVAVLRDFVESGRLEIRAAGLATWLPDFSVMRGVAGVADETVAVVGAHYFSRTYPTGGPAFTCVLAGRAAAAEAGARFEELWDRGYDVAPVLRQALERLGG